MSISNLTKATLFLCISAGTWLGSIPAAELVFRLLGDKPSPDMRGLFAPFANGGYRLGASVDTYAFYARGLVTVHTDSLGLRCDRARGFAAKPGEAVDALLLGDSQGFGNGVDFEESIAGTLARILAEEGYRVCNASVGGHSIADQFELARWLVEEQRLKVANFVVLLTPVMIFTGNKLDHAIVGHDGRLYADSVGLGTLLNLWAKTHLVIYSRVRDAVRGCGIGIDPAKGSTSVFEFYQVRKQQDAVLPDLLAGVKRLQVFASANGAAIHLVYVPLIVEADFDLVQQAAAKTGIELDPDTPLRIASSVAERLHVPLYDLKPVLKKVRAEGHRLNVEGDFHYSPVLSCASGSSLAVRLKQALGKTQVAKIRLRR
jgi:hypothetical protein